MAALAALAPAEERGFAKHASTIIGAVILALILWAGGQLLNLNNTVTRMSADVSALSKSIDGLQTGQGASAKIIGDLQRSDAAQDARDNAYEADMNRVKERVRMLEGQKPLELNRPRNAD
ncbi:hypothetical protein NHF48_019610 [Sphingomonas sp. H160509]|uniref:hypothetical protein n=1 Tax=Sphingomonas sp. H160509 TaxID=2955313 RepID=UPI002097B3B7|nr:hypothetical protein [Sphingomonas sp. H160509]MDD1452625.1 hypothetical protein [Sphingomonas sp. H160509]